MSKVAVAVSDLAKLMKELWRKVASGNLTIDHLKAFVNHQNPFPSDVGFPLRAGDSIRMFFEGDEAPVRILCTRELSGERVNLHKNCRVKISNMAYAELASLVAGIWGLQVVLVEYDSHAGGRHFKVIP